MDVGGQLIITRRIPRGGRRRGGVAVAVQGKWPDGGKNPPHGEDLTPCMCALLQLELVLFHLNFICSGRHIFGLILKQQLSIQSSAI